MGICYISECLLGFFVVVICFGVFIFLIVLLLLFNTFLLLLLLFLFVLFFVFSFLLRYLLAGVNICASSVFVIVVNKLKYFCLFNLFF